MKFGKNIIRKEFAGKPVYNGKYLKTKIKSYMEKPTQTYIIIYHNNKIPIKVLNLFAYQQF